MARGKKKETALTPEEKLAQALVPDWEQPYRVPNNWQYVFLNGATTRIKRGKAPKYVESSEYPVFAQKCNQKDGTICIEKAQFLNPALVDKFDDEEFLWDKDIVINSTGTGTLGRVGFYRSEYALPYKKVLPDSHVTVVRPAKFVLHEYLYFFLKNAQDYLELQGVGSTNQKELRSETIGAQYFPLPPLAEQQRIVDRIEYLFAKLDEAKEKAQSVLDSFETRKAAVLHKAFAGELTVKWRAEHGVGLGSWKSAKFSDVLDVRDGTHDSPQYYDTGYPLVTSKNLKDGQITDKDIKYICQEDYDKINERSKVDIGDILFAMIGTIGNPVVVQTEPHFAIKNMALFKSIGKINPFFVKYYLESKTVIDKMQKEAKGSTQKFVALGYLRAFPIDVPMKQEQEAIVRILDSLLAKEQQAKEAAEAVLEKIDLLKKSILARAIRGELGTNDPTEESALELLKTVLW